MISFTDAVKQLHAKANPKKAAEMKNSIKIDRVYLGISNQELNNTYKGWRASTSTDDRIRLAADLWDSNIYEARIVAAKLAHTSSNIRTTNWSGKKLSRWIPTLDHPTISGPRL